MNLEQTRQAEIMRAFEQGRRLYQLTHDPAYQDLLDILEAEVVKYEFRLLNLEAGTHTELLRDVLAHAKVARSIFEQLQLRINASIEAGLIASQLPEHDAQEAAFNNL